MTSVRKVAGVLVLGLLFCASVAMAADIVSFHFINTGGNTLGGVPVYPYYASVNNGPEITVTCDDFYHLSNPGDTWDAYRTFLVGGDISHTRFAGLPNAFTTYQQIAWLAAQEPLVDRATEGTINWAIWELTSPGLQFTDPNPPGEQQQIDNWIQAAEKNYLNNPAPWENLTIYTPVDAPDQEMIEIEVASPEPSTMLLLGTSIVGLWSQRKRLL
jgi:hypothetical protein